MLQKSGRLVLWEAMFILELHSAETQGKKAEDQEDQWIVDENSTILTTIFEKANKVWNLGLK